MVSPDPDDLVEKGEVVRNPGTFTEISKHGIPLQGDPLGHRSTASSPASPSTPGRNGLLWPLRSIEEPRRTRPGPRLGREGSLKGRGRGSKSAPWRSRPRRAARWPRWTSSTPTAAPKYWPDTSTTPRACWPPPTTPRAGRPLRISPGQGRLVRELAKDGGIFSFKYDEKGRCIRTSGLRVRFENHPVPGLYRVDRGGQQPRPGVTGTSGCLRARSSCKSSPWAINQDRIRRYRRHYRQGNPLGRRPIRVRRPGEPGADQGRHRRDPIRVQLIPSPRQARERRGQRVQAGIR